MSKRLAITVRGNKKDRFCIEEFDGNQHIRIVKYYYKTIHDAKSACHELLWTQEFINHNTEQGIYGK